MAWTDRVRTIGAQVRLYSDIGLATSTMLWGGDRITAIDVVEESPDYLIPRKVSETTVRLTNDLATNSDGWRGPTMSAVAVEDPADIVGRYMFVRVTDGTTVQGWVSVVDSVEATDDGATVHGLGLESLLDRTLDEAGLPTTFPTSKRMLNWILDAMVACGFPRSSIQRDGTTNPYLPAAWEADGSERVGDVIRALAGYMGCAVTVERGTSSPAIYEAMPIGDGNASSPYSWPEPCMSDRAGTLVLEDPVDGSSRELVLDRTVDGTASVSAPYSSLMSDSVANTIASALSLRLAPQWYALDAAGSPYHNGMGGVVDFLGEPVIASAGLAQIRSEKDMMIYRVEHHFDGGFSERLYGPVYDA